MKRSQRRHNLKKAKEKARRIAMIQEPFPCISAKTPEEYKEYISRRVLSMYRHRRECSCNLCDKSEKAKYKKSKYNNL